MQCFLELWVKNLRVLGQHNAPGSAGLLIGWYWSLLSDCAGPTTHSIGPQKCLEATSWQTGRCTHKPEAVSTNQKLLLWAILRPLEAN